MSGLVLCSGKRADKPYVLEYSGERVYSIEELCYYVSEYIDLLDQGFFKEDLFRWMEQELELNERADKLRLLKQNESDETTLIAALLCSSDYYTEQEIKQILGKAEAIRRLTPFERHCIRGERYLAQEKYHEAMKTYRDIFNSRQVISPEDYGQLVHNFAVAIVHTQGITSAAESFRQAFEQSNRKESLYQYLCALQMGGREQEVQKARKDYQVEDNVWNQTIGQIHQFQQEAESSEDMLELEQIKRKHAEGNLTAYEDQLDKILDRWTEEVRKDDFL